MRLPATALKKYTQPNFNQISIHNIKLGAHDAI